MANYSLVINSKFQPFSFERYLQPYQIYGQAYREQEDALAELSSKANIWDKLTNPETDQRAHSIYSAYVADLERQADELARNGLNPSSRQQMLNMRARYARDITPIEAAYKRREEQIAEQRKLGTKMIYDFDAATTSLDRYLDNPSLSYNSIDRSDLHSRAVADFGQYAKALASYGNGDKLDEFTKTFVQNYGISEDEARKFITDMRMGKIDGANPTLRAVYDALYNSTGVQNWDSQAAQNRVRETILGGVGAAIGKPTISTYEDKGAVMARQLANSKALARYNAIDLPRELQQIRQEETLKAWDPNSTYLYQAMPKSIGTKYGVSDMLRAQQYLRYMSNPEEAESRIRTEARTAQKSLTQDLNLLRQYGYIDSQNKLTNKGRAYYSGNLVLDSNGRPARDNEPLTVQRNINSILSALSPDGKETTFNAGIASYTDGTGARGLGEENFYKSITPQNAELAAMVRNGNIAEGSSPSAAALRVSRINIAGDDRAIIEDAIRTAMGTGSISQIGELDIQSRTIGNGASLSRADFDKKIADGVRVKYIGNSAYSNQLLFQMTDGTWYHMPNGVYSDQARKVIDRNNRLLRQKGLNAYQEALYGNNIMTQISQPLNTDTGTDMKKNDGTVTFTPITTP